MSCTRVGLPISRRWCSFTPVTAGDWLFEDLIYPFYLKIHLNWGWRPGDNPAGRRQRATEIENHLQSRWIWWEGGKGSNLTGIEIIPRDRKGVEPIVGQAGARSHRMCTLPPPKSYTPTVSEGWQQLSIEGRPHDWESNRGDDFLTECQFILRRWADEPRWEGLASSFNRLSKWWLCLGDSEEFRWVDMC